MSRIRMRRDLTPRPEISTATNLASKTTTGGKDYVRANFSAVQVGNLFYSFRRMGTYRKTGRFEGCLADPQRGFGGPVPFEQYDEVGLL